MKARISAICGMATIAFLGLATEAFAANEPPFPEHIPIALQDGEQAQPIEFRKIEFGIPRSKVVGTRQQCMGGGSISVGSDITYGGGGDRDREFNAVFFEEFRNAAYNVEGNPNSLFDEPDKSSADYVIAGLINDLNLRVCADASFIRGTYSSNSTITVVWQVFSRLSREVVFETTTQGYARVAKFDDDEAAMDRSVLDSFASATKGLLADEAFHNLITGAPATASGPSSPDGAPPSLYSIGYIPQSETRFRTVSTISARMS